MRPSFFDIDMDALINEIIKRTCKLVLIILILALMLAGDVAWLAQWWR